MIPVSAENPDDRQLLEKRLLILVSGRMAEERLCPGITENLYVPPMHVHDYEGPGWAKDLIGRCTGLIGGAAVTELERW